MQAAAAQIEEMKESEKYRQVWMASCLRMLQDLGLSPEERIEAGMEFVDYFFLGLEPVQAVKTYCYKRMPQDRASYKDINHSEYLKMLYPPGPHDHWANGDGRCKHHGHRFMCDECAREGRYFFMPDEHQYVQNMHITDTAFVKEFTRYTSLRRDELSPAENFN